MSLSYSYDPILYTPSNDPKTLQTKDLKVALKPSGRVLLVKFYETFAKSLEHGKILNNKKFHELLSQFQDEDEIDDDKLETELNRFIETELDPARGLGIKRMQREVNQDLNNPLAIVF